ncbi:MAG: hypothetical protein ACOYM9_02985 [Bradymonadia bacterium]
MRRTLTPWFVAMLVAALLAACGGDEESRAPARAAGAKPAKAAAKPGAEGAAPAAELANVPEKLRNVDWNAKDDLELRDARDPFKYYLDDVKPRTEDQRAATDNPCRGPLCEEEVGGLRLMAIITGTAVHKAMLIDGKSVGHVVRAGDVVGKEPYRITRITRNEVVFKPLQPPAPGQPPAQEIVKKLLGEQELQELLP